MTHKRLKPAYSLARRWVKTSKKHDPQAATRDPQRTRETTYKIILDNVRNSLTIITPGAGQTTN